MPGDNARRFAVAALAVLALAGCGSAPPGAPHGFWGEQAKAPASVASSVPAPANGTWQTSCVISAADGGVFRLSATNASSAVQETPGWVVVLYDGPDIVGSTATADESVTGGYGALVLQSRYAAPGQTVQSNYWFLSGITTDAVTGCAAVSGSGS